MGNYRGMDTNFALGYEQNLPASDPASILSRHVDMPDPAPHDLIVEVRAVSVNPVDVKLRTGASSEGFRVLGFDAAGVVVAVGSEVTLFSPGDEVFYAGSIDRPGTNQRFHAVDERIVGRKPASLSFAEAAALPLTSITAWETLFDRFRLTQENKGTLLVVGATGGVGSAVVQLAEALLPGVSVIATASDAERAAWVTELGAEHTIDHRLDLASQVQEIAPQGVDWLFTAHSDEQIPTYADIVRPFGQITAIDDGSRDVSPLKAKSITWHWELMFTRPVQRTADMIEQHRLLNAIADLVDTGRLRSTVTRSLSPITPETLREAHALIEGGRTLGKIVLHDWAS